MKSLKKSLVTLLACTMAIAPCMVGNMPVSAAGETASIAIKVTDEEPHTYQAYQLFSGTIVDGDLWNINWGSGVDKANLLKALQDATNEVLVNKFKDCTSAYDVAGVLEANKDTSGFSEAFAEIVSDHLDAVTKEGEGTKNVTIDGLDPGYYFVKDADGSLDGKNGAYTRFIMKLLSGTETANAKSDLPTLDKVINEEGGIDANTASIGDDVEFKLTSKVPDMTGYNKYFFVVNDTLSSGFTFDINSVAIKIGETTLTAPVYDDPETEGVNEATDGAYYVVDDGHGNIKIVIREFINYQAQKNQTIEITYSAELNGGASVSTTGSSANTNVANLVYSNNPNYEYQGDPSKPNEPYTPEDGTPDNPDTPNFDESKPDPTGDTPDITTVTYTTQLQITKVDGDDEDTKLSGAKFKIQKKTAGVDDEGKPIYEDILNEQETNDEGLATFKGLEVGEYQIVETAAPEGGYNLLENPIQFEITSENISTGSITWNDTNAEDDITFADGMFKIQIGNYKGSSLPTTGGMGTTLIYVLGGMLVLCSIVLIITRKRMEYRQF